MIFLFNVDEALDIPPENIRISENTLFPGLAEPEPSRVVCFPFAQHYIADSPGELLTVPMMNLTLPGQLPMRIIRLMKQQRLQQRYCTFPDIIFC